MCDKIYDYNMPLKYPIGFYTTVTWFYLYVTDVTY